MLYKWRELHEQQITGNKLAADERARLNRLSKENKEQRIKKEMLKKPLRSSPKK